MVDKKTKCNSLTKIIAVVTSLCCCIVIKNTKTTETKHSTSASYIPRNSDVSVHTVSRFSSIHSNSTTFRNFIHALSLRADAHRYIILAMTDEGYIDMAINFYETSLRAHHINNFLFVGIGKMTCDILTNISIPCFHYADHRAAHKASTYGSQDFNRKLTIRTDMMIEALEANYTVIHSDTDVVFLRNPMPHLKVIHRSLSRQILIKKLSADIIGLKLYYKNFFHRFLQVLRVILYLRKIAVYAHDKHHDVKSCH